MPKNQPNRPNPAQPRRPVPPAYRQAPLPEVVDPSWILKAGAVVLAFALLCAYILICVIFSHAQWQFVLHPSRTVSQTPAAFGLAFTPVRFGADASGQPQLEGWWIPGDVSNDPTALMLHSGDGSMSDALKSAQALHAAHLNVLLFDYRGYGQSGGQHPDQAMMQGDADSAFSYLTENRSVPSSSVIVFGSGAGASLAVDLCSRHQEVPALILDAPDGDFEQRVREDRRAKLVPVRWLFHETFPLAAPLQKLATPKLLISNTDGRTPLDLQRAADPKMTVELKSKDDVTAFQEALRRFLDSYVAHTPLTLSPNQ